MIDSHQVVLSMSSELTGKGWNSFKEQTENIQKIELRIRLPLQEVGRNRCPYASFK